MNGPTISAWRFPTLTILLILLAMLPAASQADEPVYTSTLPIVMAAPGVLIVDDEDSLREAIEAANSADQLPRIELTADITLTAPLPILNNPRAGTATIAGNDHTLDGNRIGSVLAIGPDTTVIVERLTIRNGSGSYGWEERCGGGIYSEGRLTLRQTRIVSNWARYGGGICIVSPEPVPASLTLEDTTVAGNEGFRLGGGIYVDSENGKIEVNITDSLLHRNKAQDSGGALFAFASKDTILRLNVVDSTLSRNEAVYAVGGAIFSGTYEGFIATHINRSTIAFNEANNAAGLFHEGSSEAGGQAQAFVRNSTLSGNISFGSGGAISNVDYDPILPLGAEKDGSGPDTPAPQATIGGAHMQLLYSTVAGNRANRGSGIWNEGWLLSMGSIIANNEAIGRDCWQPIRSDGYNLDSDGSCGLDEPTDLPSRQADLQPLVLVSPGNTATHALGPNSEARDRIPAGEFGCDPATDTDQRGVVRPQPVGGLCDIGAFEAESP